MTKNNLHKQILIMTISTNQSNNKRTNCINLLLSFQITILIIRRAGTVWNILSAPPPQKERNVYLYFCVWDFPRRLQYSLATSTGRCTFTTTSTGSTIIVRDRRATPFKNTIMMIPCTNKIKIGFQFCIVQHFVSILDIL